MWRKSLGSCITIEKYDDHRLMAVHFDNGSCKLLAVNIYICRMMIGLFEALIMTSTVYELHRGRTRHYTRKCGF